ncbi:hypothetical protein MKX01_012200 [Papaver californicum]|nr:hypothetical protein MKX01_012200 [Papaver californicum]
MVQLMLVFAPAACIMAGIALSGAFDVFTCSVKISTTWIILGDSEVFTTHHWMVWLYKLKPPRNRIKEKTDIKSGKSLIQLEHIFHFL